VPREIKGFVPEFGMAWNSTLVMLPELIDAAATIWIDAPTVNAANWPGLVMLTVGRIIGGVVGLGVGVVTLLAALAILLKGATTLRSVNPIRARHNPMLDASRCRLRP